MFLESRGEVFRKQKKSFQGTGEKFLGSRRDRTYILLLLFHLINPKILISMAFVTWISCS
jgi:hypothetical protein